MKATLALTLSLLAASVAGAASYTSNSILTSGSQYYEAVSVDVFTAMNGNADVAAASGRYAAQGPNQNQTGTYINGVSNNGGAFSKTVILNELYNADTLDDVLILDTFSFITREDGRDQRQGIYLEVADSTGVLGRSGEVSFDTNAVTSDNDLYGVGSFSFTGCGLNAEGVADGSDIVLNPSTSYTFTLVKLGNDGSYVTDTEYLGFGAARGASITQDSVKYGYVVDGGTLGSYSVSPIVSIATHSVAASAAIPEPTTVTLSLLSLAGLVARRRR